MNKLYSYLGLAMRAGKITAGEDAVLHSIRAGEAKIVIVAGDASNNSIKTYGDKCTYYNIPYVIASTRSELGSSIGKAERVAVAVCDSGFAKLIMEKCDVKPAEVK